jgi:hypothetical protein
MPDQNVRPDRSPLGTVRRAALQHTLNAQRALQSARPSDFDVHHARKEIKKSRAALRLLRAALPEATYRREDAGLRSAAGALNPARDARVLVRALDSLRRRRALVNDKAVAALARRLRRRQAQAQRQLHERPRLLAGARMRLREVQLRARRWRLGQNGARRLGAGFRRIYRAGRRAGRVALSHPDARTLHAWRKQVQYLWHALQILRPLQSKPLLRLARLARRLSDELGKEHDLALLHASVVAAGLRDEAVSEPLLAQIERRRRALRARVKPLGRRIYAAKPREIVARLGRRRAP